MRKSTYLLILLSFLAAAPVWAKAKKREGLPRPSSSHGPAHPVLQERFFVQWEFLYRIRSNMDHLQTLPLIHNDEIKVDIGPGQFRLTIPFR